MKINNYSFEKSRRRQRGERGEGIGIGYIVILGVFFLIFIIMAFLFLGMKKNLNKDPENELSEEIEATEDTVFYEGFKDIIENTFTDKAGYSYSIEIDPSEDNAYFLSDTLLKKLTKGSAYTISGNILERGVSGKVYVNKSEYSISYEFGFTPNKSILNADLAGYLISKGESEDKALEKGYLMDISLDEQINGTEVMHAMKKAFLNSEISEEKEDSGEYTAVYKKGTFDINTGHRYLDKLFNEYPGDMTVTITTEDDPDTDKTTTYIFIEGAVCANIVLDEYKVIDTSDLMISEGLDFRENGAFPSENSPGLSDLTDAFKDF